MIRDEERNDIQERILKTITDMDEKYQASVPWWSLVHWMDEHKRDDSWTAQPMALLSAFWIIAFLSCLCVMFTSIAVVMIGNDSVELGASNFFMSLAGSSIGLLHIGLSLRDWNQRLVIAFEQCRWIIEDENVKRYLEDDKPLALKAWTALNQYFDGSLRKHRWFVRKAVVDCFKADFNAVSERFFVFCTP